MRNLLEFISQTNMVHPNKDVLKRIEDDNLTYFNKKFIIEITIVNPYFNLDNRNIEKRSIYMFSKVININENILKLIDNIPKNGYVYFIRFLGFNPKLTQKNMPEYNTLVEKNVFIIF